MEDLARAGKAGAAGTARAHASLDDQVGRALNIVRTLSGLGGALGATGGGFDAGAAIGDLLGLTERWARQHSLRIEREIAAGLPRAGGDPALFLCLAHRLLVAVRGEPAPRRQHSCCGPTATAPASASACTRRESGRRAPRRPEPMTTGSTASWHAGSAGNCCSKGVAHRRSGWRRFTDEPLTTLMGHDPQGGQAERHRAPPAGREGRMFGKKEIKVLLVDDEVEFVTTLGERLRLRELKVDTVFDGTQALAFIAKTEPDVIVLDLKMPGLHGIDVLREIKKTRPKIQVIILTGHGTDQDEAEARKLGGFDFLRKPAEIDLLVRKIKEAFQEKVERVMSAIAFAEGGDLDDAKKIFNKEE